MNNKPNYLVAWWQLMRFHKPIGTLLLLWPTLWALWFAAGGIPDTKNLMIFIAGVIVMRAAGCVINDYADRKIDGHVTRTRARPIAAGYISPQAALFGFACLLLLALALVLQTNRLTIYLSFGAVALASLYPFMKRHTHLPGGVGCRLCLEHTHGFCRRHRRVSTAVSGWYTRA